MSLVHEHEEQSHLRRFGLDVPDLINEQRIVGEITSEDLRFRMVGEGVKQFVNQLRKQNVAAVVSPFNGLDQETGG